MMTRRLELRVPQDLFSVLQAWSRQKKSSISELAREAIELVYSRKKTRVSPLVDVMGIIEDKNLTKNIDEQLYGS